MSTIKIVINACYGGFGISRKAWDRYKELASLEGDWEYGQGRQLSRDDPDLVQVVEELGHEADGGFSELMIVEIPADVQWQIEEYDGKEWVAEKHRTWP